MSKVINGSTFEGLLKEWLIYVFDTLIIVVNVY